MKTTPHSGAGECDGPPLDDEQTFLLCCMAGAFPEILEQFSERQIRTRLSRLRPSDQDAKCTTRHLRLVKPGETDDA